MSRVKVWFWGSVLICLLSVAARQPVADTLFVEHFNTDVIASGDWTASDASVYVDTQNGWLHIGADGSYNDFADKYGTFQLPLIVEWRERLVSGGRDYTVPNMGLFWGPTIDETDFITYLPNVGVGRYGWRFGNVWTDVHTLGPNSENQWLTVKAIIRSDGGELFARADGDPTFTPIVTRVWSIPNEIVRFRLVQNWDAVCDYDYFQVTTLEPQAIGWCDDFDNQVVGGFPFGYVRGLYPGSSTDIADGGPGGIQEIDDLQSFSTPNSLKMHADGSDGSFNILYKQFERQTTGELDLRFAVYLDSEPHNASAYVWLDDIIGNATPSYDATYSCYAIYFTGDWPGSGRQIGWFDGSWHNVQPYELNMWYEVTLKVYLDTKSFDIYVNDILVGEEALPNMPSQINGVQRLKLYVDAGGTGCTAWFDDICVSPGPPLPLPVYVDIKPGSCPNPLNIRNVAETYDGPEQNQTTGIGAAGRLTPFESKPAKNVVPVAILGTADFDVSQVDPLSVKLAGVPAVRWSLENVSTPVNETGNCACNTLGPDGFVDLALKFYADDIAKALGTVKVGDYVPVKLTGKLLDGTEIEGSDCVVMVGNKSGTMAQAPTNLTNYPNPFNPGTNISFTLPVASDYRLTIYNVNGQLVEEFAGHSEGGTVSLTWDGSKMASGVYLYRLTAGDFAETKKMMLLK